MEIRNRETGEVIMNTTSSDLRGMDLEKAVLTRADLSGLDLRGVNLGAAQLFHADLRGADLRGANLQDADLRGAELEGARWDESTLWPPNFELSSEGGGEAFDTEDALTRQ